MAGTECDGSTSDNVIEESFVLLKPDALRRRLVGQIVARLEKTDLELVAAMLVTPTRELAELHYGEEIAERYGPEIRDALLNYVCGGPCLATVWRGPGAVARARETVGLRPQPMDCAPGSIRHDLGCDTIAASREEGRALENLVHTSDGPDAAEKEIRLWGLVSDEQQKQQQGAVKDGSDC